LAANAALAAGRRDCLGDGPFVLLTLVAVSVPAGTALAQGASPAPQPAQTPADEPGSPFLNGAPTVSVPCSPFQCALAPPGGFPNPTGSPVQGVSERCSSEFMPLREDAEKKGKMIKAASDRHAPRAEACELIANFGQAELKMIKYVEANTTKCGIPPQIAEQLKGGHKNTKAIQKKVCDVAQQQPQGREPAGPVGDFDYPLNR
jgi:hypothetical protein